jgi:hypothetical protein
MVAGADAPDTLEPAGGSFVGGGLGPIARRCRPVGPLKEPALPGDRSGRIGGRDCLLLKTPAGRL